MIDFIIIVRWNWISEDWHNLRQWEKLTINVLNNFYRQDTMGPDNSVISGRVKTIDKVMTIR